MLYVCRVLFAIVLGMRNTFKVLGAIILVIGVYRIVSTSLFLQRAVTVEAEVVAVEELRGPPKPPSKVPLHLKYRLSDGSEHQSKTAMPLLQKVEPGDRVQILVDQSSPEFVRLPLLSVLWATPFTLVLIGLALVAGARLVPPRGHP